MDLQSSEARAERDRRIIQETAALLSADYPLDQLIERLCDSLAASLRATVAYVALPAPDRSVRLAYLNDHGMKRRPADVVTPRGSHTHSVFTTGRSVLKRQSSDWSVFERFALNPDRPETDDSISAVWVPVKYGDDVLGVLSVQSAQANAYDTDDVRLLEAVARYLAIAVRNQRALRLSSRPMRGLRRTMAGMAVIAIVASIALLSYYSLRSARMGADARAMQTAHARAIADGLGTYLLDASQLARTSGALLAPVRGDKGVVERTLRSLLESAEYATIYGAGAWYQPGVFRSDIRYFGPYVHRDPAHLRHIVLTYEWTRKSYDFPHQYWYRAGKAANGNVTMTEPYFDTDQVYVSAVKAFYGPQRRFAGVVTVDLVVPQLRKYIAAQSRLPQTVAYVLTRDGKLFLYPERKAIFAYARGKGLTPRSVLDIPAAFAPALIASSYGGDRKVVETAVPYTGWRVVVSQDETALNRSIGAFRFAIFAALAVLWLTTIAAIAAYRRARIHQLRTLDLELAQVQLHSEIASRIEIEEKLRESAYHDTLTGLPNRLFLLKELDVALRRAREDEAFGFSVYFIDLDRFNVVNDSLGHVVGDKLLGALGRRIESRLHASDIVARIGGDEFVVLVPGTFDPAEATRIGDRLTGALADPFFAEGQEVFLTASLGIALCTGQYEKPEEILRDADIAMYHAKKAGRAGHQLFDSAMHEQTILQMKLETDLRRAVARDEFFLEYQPIVRTTGRNVVGFEALIRWRHPAGFTVYPDDFIPIAEQTRLIFAIGTWVLAHAAEQIAAWRRRNPELYVLVNISAMRLARSGFRDEILDVLKRFDLPPAAVRLEITESAIMENPDRAEATLRDLRDAGIRSQIDDFGTGYSSLSYLQRLPIDGLKIDRSFVGSMTRDAGSAEIVRAVVSLARALELSVIAEGVETQEQAEQIAALGIDFGQGYYYARPAVAQNLEGSLEHSLGI